MSLPVWNGRAPLRGGRVKNPMKNGGRGTESAYEPDADPPGIAEGGSPLSFGSAVRIIAKSFLFLILSGVP